LTAVFEAASRGAEAPPELSILLVTWEPGEELLSCIDSLAVARHGCGVDLELVVVDNGSRWFPQAEVRRAWPDAVVIANTDNRGFGPAVNQAARVASGQVLLLLNPDTRVDGDPFTPLASAFGDSHVVAVAPRLVETGEVDDVEQEVFQLRHLPTLWAALRELWLIDRLWPDNRWLRRDRYLDRAREQAFDVEQPAAAALAVRASTFAAIGGMDERFRPAWYEDVDLCARLGRLGRLVYWPGSTFRHVGGVSARRLGYDRFLPIIYRNACRYWRKHHGLTGGLSFRALLASGMLLRLVTLPLRRRVPRPRSEAARAYARTLAVALGGEAPRPWDASRGPCAPARRPSATGS